MQAIPLSTLPDIGVIDVSIGSGGTGYILPGGDLNAVTTTTLLADRVNYEPWFITEPITISTLAIAVTTFAASSVTRLAIYKADYKYQPTTLVVDAGTVSTGSNGEKTASITSRTLPPGRYVGALCSDGAPVLRAMRNGGIPCIYNTLGASPFSALMQESTTSGIPAGGFASTGVKWDEINSSGNPMVQALFVRF